MLNLLTAALLSAVLSTASMTDNHAALARTFEFINEDESCKDVQFIIFGGDQFNTGYSNQQDKLDDEMVNYRRLVGGLGLYRNSKGEDLSSFKFEAPANKMNDNRQKLLALCEQYGCPLFINGHEHNQDFPVAMFGNTPDIDCGSMVHNTWSIVGIADGDSYDRVVLRLVDKDFRSTAVAAGKLIDADLHFVYEHIPREEDSPEMKTLLSRISWKGNPLVEKLELPSSVRIVDVVPGGEDEIIRRAREENWTVKTPANWMKIIREERRTNSFRNYYVSNSGDDSADGLTPESAWRTLVHMILTH